MKIDVLGTLYEILYKNYDDDPEFSERTIDGYCDSIEKQIVICRMKTSPAWRNNTEECCKRYEKLVLRHEIIHAFLNESGLQDSSSFCQAWAKNEEMIDWIAIQLPKIVKVMKEVDCIEC